jgi:hypothetical protein
MRVVAILSFLAVTHDSAFAQACYVLEEVNVQDANGVTLYTSWFDVNNHNQFVGNYCIDPNCNPTGDAGQLVGGVIYDADTGEFETWELPFPYTWVDATSINDEGVVVGTAVNGALDVAGFVRTKNGNIFFVPVPKAGATTVTLTGINNRGVVTGHFNDPDEGGKFRGFVYANGKFTLYDASDITTSVDGSTILDINDSGDIAGQNYASSQPTGIGFVDQGASSFDVADPSAFRTGLWGISNKGAAKPTATGWLQLVEAGPQTGFVYRAGVFTYLSYPGSFDTRFHGTNDEGVLAGTFDGFSYGVIGWPCD